MVILLYNYYAMHGGAYIINILNSNERSFPLIGGRDIQPEGGGVETDV